MLNEEMHDGQRRILILPQVKTKITEGNLIVRAGLGVCAEQKTCELYRKRLQVDDIAPHPVSSLPPLEFLGLIAEGVNVKDDGWTRQPTRPCATISKLAMVRPRVRTIP